jgi:Tol biopolymer transport system component
MALLIGIIGYGVSSGKDVSPDMPILKQETFAVSLIADVDEQKALDMENSDEIQLAALYRGDDSAEEAGGSFDKEIVVRKVRFNESTVGSDNISVSPDGRYLSFANGNGNLAILDLTTGKSREITDEATWEGAQSHAIDSVWSPDGKQVVCVWSGGGHDGLRIVGLDGSQPRDLYTKTASSLVGVCYDWSDDGKYILAKLAKKVNKDKKLREIALVSVADGSVRILKSQADRLGDMTLSPDSRYVVYDCPVKEHEDLHDIFLLTTDGSGEEIRLTEHPANDYNPVWAPDGKSIVFTSNRGPDGAVGLWLIQVVDGKPAGEPQLVKKEAGDIRTLDFTEKGSLFYVTITHWSDIYVTSVDMETGQVLEPPTALLYSPGFNTMPTWSPDGKSLAYVSERPLLEGYGRRMVLVIRSVETGEERELLSVLDSEGPGQLRWSPDGRYILYGWQWEPLRLIDIETGHITEIAKTHSRIWGPAWSPDSKTIYYNGVDFMAEDWPGRIVAHDLETHRERELYPGVDMGTCFLAVSPDGRQLALNDQGLKVIPTEGGEPRALFGEEDLNLRDVGFFGGPFAWTPDGRYVLFITGTDGIVHLWKVSAEGGIPQKLLEEREMLYPIAVFSLSLHPDGQRIAFQRGKSGQVDLWVMENLLPTSTASR